MNEIFFRTLAFTEMDSILDSFIKKDFHYQHDLKPARLMQGENKDEQILAYNCVGLSKDDIKISVKTERGIDYLQIEGYRKDRCNLEFSIKNSFMIRKHIDADKITASVENGVLYIKLSVKDEFKNKEKSVSIT